MSEVSRIDQAVRMKLFFFELAILNIETHRIEFLHGR